VAATHDAAAATLGWGASDELNGLEAVMWRAEADPRLRSTIVAVEVLDRAPDWERFLAAHERGSRLVPRFRKRVEDPGLGPLRWVWDEHFELRYHVRRQRLPEGAVLQDALDEAARIAMAPFERHRSPWEAHLLEGLPDGSRVRECRPPRSCIPPIPSVDEWCIFRT
jgi:diacylglycerol O-acyltransferase / wax synthase